MQPQILVPLDGSPLAEAILPHAATLARATGSGLALLRVVPPMVLANPIVGMVPPNAFDFDYEAQRTNEALARDYLAALATQLDAPDLPVQTLWGTGDPATAIVNWAAQDPPRRRIAMTTHGRSGLGRWVFGSVAEKVLQGASVPLLLVRMQEDEAIRRLPARPYRALLVPLDGSALAEHALAQAVALAQPTGATLHLTAVVPGPEDATDFELETASLTPDAATHMHDYLAGVAAQLHADGVAAQLHVVHGHPVDGILRAADSIEADLIVMSTHGRGGLQRLWLGSVALKVVQTAWRPVLLIRA
jgi:nucleotide-binding universal stress UspA family protein